MQEIKQLQKMGNSRGVIIPSAALKLLGIKEGQMLNVSVVGKKIVVTPVKESKEQ